MPNRLQWYGIGSTAYKLSVGRVKNTEKRFFKNKTSFRDHDCTFYHQIIFSLFFCPLSDDRIFFGIILFDHFLTSPTYSVSLPVFLSASSSSSLPRVEVTVTLRLSRSISKLSTPLPGGDFGDCLKGHFVNKCTGE